MEARAVLLGCEKVATGFAGRSGSFKSARLAAAFASGGNSALCGAGYRSS